MGFVCPKKKIPVRIPHSVPQTPFAIHIAVVYPLQSSSGGSLWLPTPVFPYPHMATISHDLNYKMDIPQKSRTYDPGPKSRPHDPGPMIPDPWTIPAK